VGDGGAGDRDLKGLRGAGERHGGGVSAVAPAVDAHAGGIAQALGDEPAHAVDLVLDLEVAEVMTNRALEGEAAAGGAAVVELEDEVALRGEGLGAHVDGSAPLAGDALGVGAAVDGDEGGVGPGAGAGGGAIEGAVQGRRRGWEG
jgi:hypothetical protein